jgi:hypothetical protein
MTCVSQWDQNLAGSFGSVSSRTKGLLMSVPAELGDRPLTEASFVKWGLNRSDRNEIMLAPEAEGVPDHLIEGVRDGLLTTQCTGRRTSRGGRDPARIGGLLRGKPIELLRICGLSTRSKLSPFNGCGFYTGGRHGGASVQTIRAQSQLAAD